MLSHQIGQGTFSQAGMAFEEQMPVGEQADHRLLDKLCREDEFPGQYLLELAEVLAALGCRHGQVGRLNWLRHGLLAQADLQGSLHRTRPSGGMEAVPGSGVNGFRKT